MGGFSSAIGDVARVVGENVRAVSHVFEGTDEGKLMLNKITNIYQPTRAQMVEKGLADKLKIAAGEEAHYKQFQASGQVGPAPKLSPIDVGEVHQNAAKGARFALLGPKDVNGVLLAKSIEKKHGLAAAQSFSNALAFVLKDYHEGSGATDFRTGKLAKGGEDYSEFKRNVRSGGVGIESSPSYKPPNEIERNVTSGIYATFSPLMVVPHIATLANGLFGSDIGSFLQGTAKAASKGMRGGISDFQTLLTTGVFTESMMRQVKEWNMMKASGHPELLDNPVAKIVYKSFHQPGFGPWRDYNLLSGANVGKMTAEQVGRDLYKNPNSRKALWQATQFGLDPQKIISQGGQLDEQDLGRAIYKFVNEHYFLDNSLSRSTLLQSNWAGRVLGTYHGYVTRQSKLMAKAMFRDFGERGPASVVKNFAVGMTLMPLMGEGIKLIQQTYRGQDAGKTLDDDIKGISGRAGVMGFGEAYFGALAHVGAYGVFGHVIRGAATHSILQSASGPIGSATADLLQDTYGAMKKDFTDHPRDIFKRNPRTQKHWVPVERDLMFDTPGVSLLAQFLAHRVLPNSKDNPRHDPVRKLYHHVRGEDSYGNPIEEQP